MAEAFGSYTVLTTRLHSHSQVHSWFVMETNGKYGDHLHQTSGATPSILGTRSPSECTSPALATSASCPCFFGSSARCSRSMLTQDSVHEWAGDGRTSVVLLGGTSELCLSGARNRDARPDGRYRIEIDGRYLHVASRRTTMTGKGRIDVLASRSDSLRNFCIPPSEAMCETANPVV
jgi:hypothetical protein